MSRLPKGFGPSKEGYINGLSMELGIWFPSDKLLLLAEKPGDNEDWVAVADPKTSHVWMVCMDH